jgi:hypothetical protein
VCAVVDAAGARSVVSVVVHWCWCGAVTVMGAVGEIGVVAVGKQHLLFVDDTK